MSLQVRAFGVADELERREATRTRTVYRVVRVQNGKDEGLGRVRNLSDGGMKLELGLAVGLNDMLEVELSPGVVLQGQVVWIDGSECGLRFNRSIDSIRVLSDSAREKREPGARPPRLKALIRAATQSDRGMRTARVSDVSQSGMKLEHDGYLTPGLQLKVTFGSGVERRGTARV